MSELTLHIDAARQGDPKAAGEAFGLLCEDLRRLAERTVRRDREKARRLLQAAVG